MKSIMICCAAMALVVALVYFLMGVNVISLPGLSADDAPSVIVFIASACYAIGGLLILAKKRWLWTIGLAMNALVIGIFFAMYNQRANILFSLPGMGTKIPQAVLEVGLGYLLVKYRRAQPNRESIPVT